MAQLSLSLLRLGWDRTSALQMCNLTFSEIRASWGKWQARVVEPGSGLWSSPVSRCEIVSGDVGTVGYGEKADLWACRTLGFSCYGLCLRKCASSTPQIAECGPTFENMHFRHTRERIAKMCAAKIILSPYGYPVPRTLDTTPKKPYRTVEG